MPLFVALFVRAVAASALAMLYALSIHSAALAAEPKLDLSMISPSEYRQRLNDARCPCCQQGWRRLAFQAGDPRSFLGRYLGR